MRVLFRFHYAMVVYVAVMNRANCYTFGRQPERGSCSLFFSHPLCHHPRWSRRHPPPARRPDSDTMPDVTAFRVSIKDRTFVDRVHYKERTIRLAD